MSELKTNLEQILQEKTTKLIPENIKRKVEIFDVTGTDGDAEVEELQAKIIETRQEIADTRRDLENSAATVTGTGENVTLNQTAEATFKKLGVGGNTKQNQYTGKNLAKVSGSSSLSLTGDITINKNSNDITLNGTATGDVAEQKAFAIDGNSIGNYAAYINPSNTLSLTAGTYVLTINNITGSYSGVGAFWIRLEKKNTSTPHTTIASLTLPSTSIVINIVEDGEYFISPNFSYTAGTNVIFNNYKFNIMLASGTDTTYEPYVGGIASPNPDYPQEIENVTGDIETLVENKNLAWNGWAEDFVRRINNIFAATIEIKDNKNCLKQSANAGWKDYDNKYIFKTNFKENTQYTLIFDVFVDRSTKGNIGIEHTDGTVVEPSNLTLNAWNKVVLTSLPNKTIKYIRSVYRDGAEWIDLDTFMVYEGIEQIDFIQHKEQKFIFPLVEGQKLMLGDYLADDGIHTTQAQITFNGSESWDIAQDAGFGTNYTQASGYIAFAKNISDSLKQPLNNVSKSACNIAYPKTWYNLQATPQLGYCILNYTEQGTSNYARLWITMSRSIVNTLDEWKTWLQSNNILIENELLQEVVVPYTEEQQQVYNEMKKVISYEGQTNVIGSSNGSNPIFTVIAFKDADLVITSLDNQLTLKE